MIVVWIILVVVLLLSICAVIGTWVDKEKQKSKQDDKDPNLARFRLKDLNDGTTSRYEVSRWNYIKDRWEWVEHYETDEQARKFFTRCKANPEDIRSRPKGYEVLLEEDPMPKRDAKVSGLETEIARLKEQLAELDIETDEKEYGEGPVEQKKQGG